MATFSKVSEERLRSCAEPLQRVARAAIKRIDFAVIEGHRDKERQHQAFVDGFSKVDWPDSRHNSMPSEAMDLVPYPVDWSDHKRFRTMAMIVLEEAARLGIELEWGGDWKSFPDLPHFELKR